MLLLLASALLFVEQGSIADPEGPPCRPLAGPVAGKLVADTTWCGLVQVEGNVFVPRGVTLTVLPGTIVSFRAYRGYRDPERRLTLRVEGRLVARGTPQRMIRFTSSHRQPRNGDWSMVKLVGASGSQIDYAIFEFAQQGLNLWATDMVLSHLILRYHNWEGIYLENHCHVAIEFSRIYSNGYNCIAAEQYNELFLERNYLANCGTSGLLIDASRAVVKSNLFEGGGEGLVLDNDAVVTAWSNRFSGQSGAAISCGEGRNHLCLDRNIFDGVPPARETACPRACLPLDRDAPEDAVVLQTDLAEDRGPVLHYLPGDRLRDPYPYVYPDRDETREVLTKIGSGMGLTWSLTWDGRALWTASLEGLVFQLDPGSGKVLRRFVAPGPQPWGMAFDGQLLWINDFARRQIFGVNPRDGRVRRSFPAPDSKGGCKGLAFDGEHLYALGWGTKLLYRLSREGRTISTSPVPSFDLGGKVRIWVAGGLTWDGEAFWGPANRLVRFDRQGRTLGWVYSTSERVWDLAWDGKHLWTTQRANETWQDFPRLFRIKVLKLRTD